MAWLLKNDTLATFYDFGLRFAPTGFFWVAFSFLYWFFPNTTVRPLSALLGGAVAALLFTFAQILFVDYASSAARYDALFGGFAALPLFLIWVYLSWAVILLGAEVSFAHQNLAQYRRQVQGDPLNDAEREALALRIAVEVAAAFRDGRGPWTADALAEAVDVPVRAVREVIQPLEAAGLIQACAVQEREGAYQLGRAAESIRVSDVLEALRGRWPAETGAQGPAAETVRAVFREWAASLETSVGPRPLSELLTAIPPRQGGPDRG